MKQITKVRTLSDAIAMISSGDTVAVGGRGKTGRPVSLAREIARQRKHGLRLVCFGSGIEVEMLVGAGCVDRIDCACDERAPDIERLAVRQERAPHTVTLAVHEEEVVLASYRAGAAGIPFQPLGAAVSADDDPWVKRCTSPYSGTVVPCVAAMRPDVAILHAEIADRDGNVRLAPNHAGNDDTDLVLARAAKTVIVSVEQFVSSAAIAADTSAPMLRTANVACVVEAPYGAWPYAFDTRYRCDEAMFYEYVRLSRHPDTFAEWMRDSVFGPPDHDAFLERIGARRLLVLTTRLAVKA